MKLLTVAELIRYRMRHERYVRRVAEGVLPTRYGDFRMIVYSSDVDREQHIALVRGDLEGAPPLVRVQSHCLTGDVFGSAACDCSELVATIARNHCQRRSRRVLYAPHRPRIQYRHAGYLQVHCRAFTSIRAGNSIGKSRGSGWCNTKAALARRYSSILD